MDVVDVADVAGMERHSPEVNKTNVGSGEDELEEEGRLYRGPEACRRTRAHNED